MRNHSGQFKKGPDARRHKFTREECQRGFWAAIESIASRYPDATDASGTHMVKRFLRTKKKADTKTLDVDILFTREPLDYDLS